MAITLVTEPTTGAPITASDYTAQNGLISANQVPMLSALSSWESTAAAPTIKQNAFIRHAGNTYQVDTADETISGAPVSGINYIELTLSGSTLTAAWVTSLTGYAYNPAYGGIYNGSGDQLMRDVCYLDGSDYYRGLSNGMGYDQVVLSNGTYYPGPILPGPVSTTAMTPISISVGGYITLPQGVWLVSFDASLDGYFHIATDSTASYTIISDGTMRVYNNFGSTLTGGYRRIA